MGRPQDWLMVGMSLVILFQAYRPSSEAAPGVSGQRTETPFAYIREDGIEIPVPARGDGVQAEPVLYASVEELHADPGLQAVLTWSSPVSASTAAQ